MTNQVEWTESYIQQLNARLKNAGLPQLIIDNGFVYKDELHKFLGIGIK
jgi:hypothetical protein